MQPRGDQIVLGPGRQKRDPIRSKREEEAEFPILKLPKVRFVAPLDDFCSTNNWNRTLMLSNFHNFDNPCELIGIFTEARCLGGTSIDGFNWIWVRPLWCIVGKGKGEIYPEADHRFNAAIIMESVKKLWSQNQQSWPGRRTLILHSHGFVYVTWNVLLLSIPYWCNQMQPWPIFNLKGPCHSPSLSSLLFRI